VEIVHKHPDEALRRGGAGYRQTAVCHGVASSGGAWVPLDGKAGNGLRLTAIEEQEIGGREVGNGLPVPAANHDGEVDAVGVRRKCRRRRVRPLG